MLISHKHLISAKDIETLQIAAEPTKVGSYTEKFVKFVQKDISQKSTTLRVIPDADLYPLKSINESKPVKLAKRTENFVKSANFQEFTTENFVKSTNFQENTTTENFMKSHSAPLDLSMKSTPELPPKKRLKSYTTNTF